MPIDLRIEGDASQCHEVAAWLEEGLAASAQRCVGHLASVNVRSELVWAGPAGDAFRGTTGRATDQGDDLDGRIKDLGRAIEAYAVDLDTLRARLDQAREVALAGGLDVTDAQVADPGPAPPPVPGLPPSPTAGDIDAQITAAQAVGAYNQRVAAYKEAAEIAGSGRQIQRAAETGLMDHASALLSAKALFTALDGVINTVGTAHQRYSPWRIASQQFFRKATAANALATNPMMSHDRRMAASMRETVNRLDGEYAKQRASATALARAINQLPTWVTAGGTYSPGHHIPKAWNGRVATKVTTVGKSVPYAGIVVNALGAGYEISQGKPADQALVSSGASVVTGGLTTVALAGAPVALVVVAGIGVVMLTDAAVDKIYENAEEPAAASEPPPSKPLPAGDGR